MKAFISTAAQFVHEAGNDLRQTGFKVDRYGEVQNVPISSPNQGMARAIDDIFGDTKVLQKDATRDLLISEIEIDNCSLFS